MPRSMRPLSALIAVALVVAGVTLATVGVRAENPANEHFQRTWDRTDEPVANGTIARTWIWGPVANTGPLQEDYANSPGGKRTVQYFDKSRMEINDPSGNPSSPFYVTNGLLVVGLMSGQMQVGETQFVPREPAEVNVAGDQGDPNSPTYADLAPLRSAPPAADGAVITQHINGNGVVTTDPTLASQNVTAAYRVTVPNIDHQVASPFWAFLNSTGPVIVNGQPATERLFDPWFYATGYPITEAYWADVLVGGQSRLVLMQCFERRCLTYTPGNPPGFETEAGNVGQHYYTWRYEQPSGGSPTATPTATATATATATMTATATATTPTEEPTIEYEWNRSWGELYPQVPRLNFVYGIGIDERDHLWVADDGNNRVVEFDENGIYQGSFGTEGSGPGQFMTPLDVAVANERVYVADWSRNVVQVFDDEGTYLYQWGSTGAGNGQFGALAAIVVHNNAAYTLDQAGRVQVFDLNGNFIFGFGSTGTGNGQFDNPVDLAVDAQGNIYVADRDNHRIQKFSNTGTYLSQFGSFGEGIVQFKQLSGIAIADDGRVYVSDRFQHRVQVLTTDGGFIGVFGTEGFGQGQFQAPYGIAVDSTGDFWVSDLVNGRVQKFTDELGYRFFASDSSRAFFEIPTDITIDRDGNLLITDPQMDLPVITRYDSFGVPLDHYRHLEYASSQYDQPYAAAVSENGDTYVVDRYANRVQRFSPTWTLTGSWGTSGTASGQFTSPQDIAVDADGNVYVVDTGNNRVQKFDANGVFLDAWGGIGNGNGQFNNPSGITVDGNRVYVTDNANHRVQVFNRSGDYLDEWGQQGSGEADLNGPIGIATDAEGNVFVVDNGNDRVQIFTPSGEPIGRFGGPGTDAGEFDGPFAIAVDANGNAYVSDIGNHRTQKFERQP